MKGSAEGSAILAEIRAVVDAWKASAPDGRSEAVRQFEALLARLYESGWDDALGWQRELPDEFLPARYLTRRAQRIDELEIDLARFSAGWRRSREHPSERAAYYEAYRDTIDELFRVGHWAGEPDAESQLPYELMPESYKQFWQARIKR